jgi:prephenate dehydrogenase
VSEPGPIRVAILGTGLIGGSIGLALRDASGWSVTGWDPDSAALHAARNHGALNLASKSLADAVHGANLVVFAAPVSAVVDLFSQLSGAVEPQATVTDVGSTKARIVAEGERELGGRFVGGHPMAGSAGSGAAAASADLFLDASWFLTPTPATTPDSLRLVRSMAQACGAVVRECSPDEHDRLVAVLSHLPHLLAYGLATTAAHSVPAKWRSAAAGSFRDGTRVAASAASLWAEILMENRDETLRAMEAHGTWMDQARHALESCDCEALLSLLSHANVAKRAFPTDQSGDE